MSSPSRKRILQELTLQSSKNSPSTFPTLFNLAIQTCISHLHIFATFEGLPFYPFGQALFAEFVKRSNQWRITTEQRQVGIFLFAETYGHEFLGPEYTGLRCSFVHDIPYLSSFRDCLVYLDLSGGCGSGGGTSDGGQAGFADKDIAGLSALSRLLILNLSQLKIGDIGLSHLIRSVTYGSSGPAMLEYLNLSGTGVTDVGIAKMFDTRDQKSLVFKRLLGIDLTDSKVHNEVAETLFRNHAVPWRRLENRVILFPDFSTNKAVKEGHADLYLESGSDLNPMQKWVDCFSDRSFKVKFGHKPDLSQSGKDAWGLSECLALAKLGQIYFHPISEPTSNYQQEYWWDGEESTLGSSTVGKRSRSKRSRYVRDFEDMLLKAAAAKETQLRQQQSGLEHMYNLAMYQSVLSSIRETAGSLVLTKSSRNISVSGGARRLAFVRSRIEVDDLFAGLELGNDNNEEVLQTSAARNTDSMTKAKIRDRRRRVTASSFSESQSPSLQPLENQISLPQDTPVSLSSPFSKRPRLTTSSPFIKQESLAPIFSNSVPSSSYTPGHRRVFGAHSKYHPPPFVKPAAEQISSNIFITNAKEKTSPSASSKLQPSILHAKKPPKLSSAAMMERWVSQTKQSPSESASSNDSNASIPKDKGHGPYIGIGNGSKNIVREFHFTDENNDTVNLDRWIRSGPVVRGLKGGNNRNEFERVQGDGRPRNVIRFDPKNELFADRDNNVDNQH
ncbi:hypothetical protein BGX27_001115 [Mortierella sp. AM989]|nr:hypothetical protein BGX27_001115 [Mortierella sp. AM989]